MRARARRQLNFSMVIQAGTLPGEIPKMTHLSASARRPAPLRFSRSTEMAGSISATGQPTSKTRRVR